MAKLGLYLFLFAIFLPSILSQHFPGDGCCIRWDRFGACCVNIRGECCGERRFGREFGFRHGHFGPGEGREHHEGSFGRGGRRPGFNSVDDDRVTNNRQDGVHQGNTQVIGNDRQNNGQFGETNRQGSRQSVGGDRQGSGQFTSGNQQGSGQSTGGGHQGSGQFTSGNHQGSGQSTEGDHQRSGQFASGNHQASGQSTGGDHQGSGQFGSGNHQASGQSTGGDRQGSSQFGSGNQQGSGHSGNGGHRGSISGNQVNQ